MANQRSKQFFRRTLRWPAWVRYTLAFALAASCSALCHSLDSMLGRGVQFTAFYLVVVICVYLCGTGPAIFAVLLSVITTDFRFIEPRGQFKFNERIVVAESLFILICASIVGTVHAMRRAQSGVEAESDEIKRRAQAAEKAEAALRESENRKSAILSASLDAIITMDHQGKVVDFNPAAETIFGYRSEEAIGRHLADLIIPERLRERHYQGLAKYLATGKGPVLNKRIELPALHANGHEFPVEISINPISGMEPPMFTATLRDISERKQAEEALRQSETLLRTVTNESRVGLVMVDKERRYLFANPTYAEILGLPSADIVGQRVPDVLADVYCDQIQPRLDRAMNGERTTYELHLPAHAQRKVDRFYEVVYEPRKTANSDPYVMVVLVDITERKQTEQAMRESSERLQLALAAGHLGDWTWDARADVFTPSVRSAEIFNFPPGTSGTWTTMREFVHEDDRERARLAAEAAIHNRTDYNIEYRVKRPSGELRWIAARGRGTYAADGTFLGMTGVVQDITDRKLAEEALRQAQVELQANAVNLKHTVEERTAQLREKIGELEAFSYSVSHDMRQPLRAMQGYARILLQDHGEKFEDEPKQFLERIITAANRLDRLIQDVLTYSRTIRGESELSIINLDKLVREVVETYPALRGSHIEIVPSTVSVLGYEVALTQCIANLLGNALKFVPAGATPQVKVWSETTGDLVRFWVQDNGIGIAKKDQEKIFEIFSRVHGNDDYEGTGIGLSIVKKAVEKMGGRVGVDSELGKGSRFWIELQKAQDAPDSPA
ncbi:MAG: Multi-sensor signal transduction histidine kinase [Pedosphaera sp.]|nr:Multi-sensor signal transduction histidine kinase [Pedosphaera sp.]